MKALQWCKRGGSLYLFIESKVFSTIIRRAFLVCPFLLGLRNRPKTLLLLGVEFFRPVLSCHLIVARVTGTCTENVDRL